MNETTASLVVAIVTFLRGPRIWKKIYSFIYQFPRWNGSRSCYYDTMAHQCDVSTICIGMAASMGAFLLAGGAKGKRLALPNAEIMIHQPFGGAKGQATEIRSR